MGAACPRDRDPALQALALEKLREERFNAEVAATLATLAPREHRKTVIEAIVAYEIMYDYLDRLTEQPTANPISDGRDLYRAFMDAVTLDSEPTGGYYTSSAQDDGGYLEELVGVVQSALATLPSTSAISLAARGAARRCAEAQVRAHAVPALGVPQLEQWARSEAQNIPLGWQEFLAGAASSVLAVHALIAAAADERTTPAHASELDTTYLSICALSTMLDSLVDHQRDAQSGQVGYLRYYQDHDLLARDLAGAARRAVEHTGRATRRRAPRDDARRCCRLLHLRPDRRQRPRPARDPPGPPGARAARHPNACGHAHVAGRQASPRHDPPPGRQLMPADAAETDDDPVRQAARYVAIIADGNGRWARSRGVPINDGHEAGADTLKMRLRDAVELGIEQLTVYSFSTENWSRPAEEVRGLVAMLAKRIAQETPELHREGVRMRFIGRREGVPGELVEQMRSAETLTADNQRLRLFIAFNYGSRAEILDAARRFTGGGEEEFRRGLYAPEMHDPDVIIRTGGEQRLSNYLLWQAAYSELVFRDELWPDFTQEALKESLAEFNDRRCCFGGR